MPRFTIASLGLLLTLFFTVNVGCELIATVDRGKIPGAGGSGGAIEASASSGTGGVSPSSASSASSGTGGASASSASSASSGTGGDGGTPCKMPEDCPAPANECVTRTCKAGTCGTKDVAKGTKTATQKPGDCKQNECDGKGAIASVNDDTDTPDDGNDCTDDVCTAGVPSNPDKAASTPCGANGSLLCDGSGQCVGCVAPTDCSGQDTECQTRTCAAGVCGVSNAASGKLVSMQTAGDCQVNQCDGNGAVQTVPDNADVPVDGETCTKDLCTNGVPANPPEDVGTACSEGSGTQCDGAGKCAACLVATDCLGQDTECQQRACNAGACGVTFAPLGAASRCRRPATARRRSATGTARRRRSRTTRISRTTTTCAPTTCARTAPPRTPT